VSNFRGQKEMDLRRTYLNRRISFAYIEGEREGGTFLFRDLFRFEAPPSFIERRLFFTALSRSLGKEASVTGR